jgi:O-antigen ligase
MGRQNEYCNKGYDYSENRSSCKLGDFPGHTVHPVPSPPTSGLFLHSVEHTAATVDLVVARRQERFKIVTVDIFQKTPPVAAEDRWVQRRISVIWALLILNCLTWTKVPTLIATSRREAQIFTVGALLFAALLAFTLNRRLVIRPNLVLSLVSLLAVTSSVTSVRGTAGFGADIRCARLFLFLAVLWLLTPWWGRRDLLLVRAHLRALLGVVAVIAIGLVVSPSLARSGPNGRLIGIIWPIWPTAVAHYGAMSAGIGVILWLSGLLSGRRALALSAIGVAFIVLSKTRTPVIGLPVALICAITVLFISRRRVRRVVTIALIVVPLGALVLAPAFSVWFARDQSKQQITQLTGRTRVWSLVGQAPRSQFGKWFGYGISNNSFKGLPIDSSWLAVYQDQGLVGDAIVGAILLTLVVGVVRAPAGPARALATFIVVYCAVLSITEVGLGSASVYLLELVVAASLLVPTAGAIDPPSDVPLRR